MDSFREAMPPSGGEPFLLLHYRLLGALGSADLVDILRNNLFAQFAADCSTTSVEELSILIRHHAEGAGQFDEMRGLALLNFGVVFDELLHVGLRGLRLYDPLVQEIIDQGNIGHVVYAPRFFAALF